MKEYNFRTTIQIVTAKCICNSVLWMW